MTEKLPKFHNLQTEITLLRPMTEKVQLLMGITLIRPSKIKEKVMTYDFCLSVVK